MSRPRGSADQIAARRRRALKLLDEGFSLHEVARRVGSHASSVMRWRDTRRRKGDRVFEVRASPGRPSKLSSAQKKKLEKILLKGALAYGYRTELWTCDRIAAVIRKEFAVRYHRDHVGRVMGQIGWSYQKPERKATQRDEDAIDRWKHKEWRRLKKTPRGWAPTSSS